MSSGNLILTVRDLVRSAASSAPVLFNRSGIIFLNSIWWMHKELYMKAHPMR